MHQPQCHCKAVASNWFSNSLATNPCFHGLKSNWWIVIFILIMTHLVSSQFNPKISQKEVFAPFSTALNTVLTCVAQKAPKNDTQVSSRNRSGAGRFRVWEINNSFSGWTCLLWLHFPSFLREGKRTRTGFCRCRNTKQTSKTKKCCWMNCLFYEFTWHNKCSFNIGIEGS